MKGKKIILLSLALLLPIGIFLFLKFFGKNQFEVLPLHQDTVITVSTRCNFNYQRPYTLPDSLMRVMQLEDNTPLSILNFSADESVLQRVRTEFDTKEVQIMDAAVSAQAINTPIVKECILLMTPPYDIVLIDAEKRIRGYYTGSDREEIDRLLIELSIILKKY